MASNRDEIIADIKEHVRRVGGGFDDWCVGIAKDTESPFFQCHRLAEKNDGLIYREAYTDWSAQAVRDYLVAECGAHPEADEQKELGRLIFVYRKTACTHR